MSSLTPKVLSHLIFKLRRFRYRTNEALCPDRLILTYLCPNAQRASGGVKVIYRHVSQINQMQLDGVKAQIFHPKELGFRCDLPFDDLAFKEGFSFNKNNEVLVIHEMWAAREARIARDKGIRYIIQVQNGYEIFRKATMASVYPAYEHAELITCVSDDIYACLVFLFPEFKQKIVRLHLSVESDVFKPAGLKQNLITYMPRKLEKHSRLVVNYLARKLPDNWSLLPIQNMSQSEVAQALAKSRIFLSFSELEGLGLPPLEAALAGNLVIGYTGQAGKEYWLENQFHEVHCGDIRQFATLTLDKINDFDRGCIDVESFDQNIALLKNQFSLAQELADLRDLVQRLSARIM